MGDVLVSSGVGSTDWTGGVAPAGGIHTGQSVITMSDGAQFTVAHNAAEVRVKIGAPARTVPNWIAFDVPGTAVPVVLDADLVTGVR